jgi:hypothetical protein
MSFRNIYIIRHQQGDTSNCVSSNSVITSEGIANMFKRYNIRRIISRYPYNDKHIRPIQTAANICSFLNTSLELVYDANTLPSEKFSNILVVWNHNDISSILKRYGFQEEFNLA